MAAVEAPVETRRRTGTNAPPDCARAADPPTFTPIGNALALGALAGVLDLVDDGARGPQPGRRRTLDGSITTLCAAIYWNQRRAVRGSAGPVDVVAPAIWVAAWAAVIALIRLGAV
jgi:hypothetical protein